MSNDSTPEVFIIESLRREDERDERFEGHILRDILKLSGKSCEYFYIRTRRELKKLLPEFADTRFRYLHVSCHANDEGMATTYDSIGFPEFGSILRPYLHKRRVFLSACEMATPALASELFNHSSCFSVLGPQTAIGFADAALLWSSFYHLMFRTDSEKMKRKWLEAHARSTSNLFAVPLNLFLADSQSARGFQSVSIRPTVE